MKLINALKLFICCLLLASIFTAKIERTKRIKKSTLKASNSLKVLNKFVSSKAGHLTLDDLVNAAKKEPGFEDRLEKELSKSPVSDDLRITRIRLLENKEEYGMSMTVRGRPKRYPHQSIALCIKSYSLAKNVKQDDIDNKTTAYYFLFERMVQYGMPDLRFQYLGWDIDCRDGTFSTAKNWEVAEMFTLNADIEAAIKVDEKMHADAKKAKEKIIKGIQEFFIAKAKEQAAWLAGHAALSVAHATGIGIVVSGPIHLIYGAAHAIHTAVGTVSDILDGLEIAADIKDYIKNILDNPYQKKIENDKVKDQPENNRSVRRFIDAMNRYEVDLKNVWELDISDSRTFATGFYNAIKQGHENDDYVTFKYFTKDTENNNVHAKKYFK